MSKKILFSVIVAAVLLLYSCSVPSYYQVFKTQSKEKMLNVGNWLVYSDDNCTIFYNFWSDGGNVNFTILNHSDKNIYLNMKECFFIHNGYAYDYFKNRTHTSTKGVQVGESEQLGFIVGESESKTVSRAVSGVNFLGYPIAVAKSNTATVGVARSASRSVSVAHSSSSSVSWKDPEIICIPPKAGKEISEFGKISSFLFRICGLPNYPTDQQTYSGIFSEAESPLVFCNMLAYYLGDSQDLIRINNEFYVSEIKNLTEKNMIVGKWEYEEYCGEKSYYSKYKEYWIEASPDKFYISYDYSSRNFYTSPLKSENMEDLLQKEKKGKGLTRFQKYLRDIPPDF